MLFKFIGSYVVQVYRRTRNQLQEPLVALNIKVSFIQLTIFIAISTI